jgi:hypothetical protein
MEEPMDVLVQPSSWHFETKNWPTGYTYYFNIRLDNSAPLTGEVTLSEIRGRDGEILVNHPVKFT